MRVLIFFISLFFLVGCVSQQERTDKFLKENPEYFAEKCAINFPVKEEFIAGDPIRDTIEIVIPGVEIPCPEYIDQDGQLHKPKVRCPDSTIKTIKTTITNTITKENTANVIRLKTENSELVAKNKALSEEISELKNQLKGWIITAVAVFFFFLSSIYLHFKR